MCFVCGCDQSWNQQYWFRGRGGDRSWSAWRAVADVARVCDAGVGDVHDRGEDRRSGVMASVEEVCVMCGEGGVVRGVRSGVGGVVGLGCDCD